MGGACRVLAVPGSLRAGSTNRAVLHTAAALGVAGVSVVLYDGLADLPHFNPDDDVEPLPPAVHELRRALDAADAVLFSTPEYAGALPGSFKNLLDWSVGGGEIYRKRVLATLRPDGSPRVSGTEVVPAEGELSMGTVSRRHWASTSPMVIPRPAEGLVQAQASPTAATPVATGLAVDHEPPVPVEVGKAPVLRLDIGRAGAQRDQPLGQLGAAAYGVHHQGRGQVLTVGGADTGPVRNAVERAGPGEQGDPAHAAADLHSRLLLGRRRQHGSTTGRRPVMNRNRSSPARGARSRAPGGSTASGSSHGTRPRPAGRPRRAGPAPGWQNRGNRLWGWWNWATPVRSQLSQGVCPGLIGRGQGIGPERP